MARDLSVLEFKDDDSDDIRAMKAYLKLVYDMEPAERRYFIQEERVSEAEHHLQYMIERNQRDDYDTAYFIKRIEEYVENYEQDNDEKQLEAAELCAEIAKGIKRNRYTIADIRKQREVIQWERKKLSKMNSVPSEPSQSSSPSVN